MLRTAFALTLLSCVSLIPAHAASLSFTGNFAGDDDLWFVDFSLSAPGSVTVRTLSYAGGTNATGQTIFAGGFDPLVSLFDSLGNLVDLNDDGGSSLDSLLQVSLSAGIYRVALTQSGNSPSGLMWADGFSQTGDPFYTGSSYGCPAGQFCDFLGNDRTNEWAMDVLGVDTPEPSTVLLLAPALALLAMNARRR